MAPRESWCHRLFWCYETGRHSSQCPPRGDRALLSATPFPSPLPWVVGTIWLNGSLAKIPTGQDLSLRLAEEGLGCTLGSSPSYRIGQSSRGCWCQLRMEWTLRDRPSNRSAMKTTELSVHSSSEEAQHWPPLSSKDNWELRSSENSVLGAHISSTNQMYCQENPDPRVEKSKSYVFLL